MSIYYIIVKYAVSKVTVAISGILKAVFKLSKEFSFERAAVFSS